MNLLKPLMLCGLILCVGCKTRASQSGESETLAITSGRSADEFLGTCFIRNKDKEKPKVEVDWKLRVEGSKWSLVEYTSLNEVRYILTIQKGKGRRLSSGDPYRFLGTATVEDLTELNKKTPKTEEIYIFIQPEIGEFYVTFASEESGDPFYALECKKTPHFDAKTFKRLRDYGFSL